MTREEHIETAARWRDDARRWRLAKRYPKGAEYMELMAKYHDAKADGRDDEAASLARQADVMQV